MAGAIAGTALLDLKSTKSIDIVTLTVNNACNLNCPHCYLKYDGIREYVSDNIIDTVLQSDFRHLAIVGKEPLYNKEHAQKTSNLIQKVTTSGKTISLISNGVNLQYLNNSELLKFADISFDGGPQTYNATRQSDYSKLINKINNSPIKNINALHTLYQQNINNISDMVKINEDASFQIIMFSPYLKTNNQRLNTVEQIDLDLLLEKLTESKEFMDANNTLLNMDIFHSKQYNVSISDIKVKASKLGLTNKLKLFETDLLKEGVVRVTYDGLVLSPENSLHTAKYSNKIKLNENLTDAYYELLKY